MPQDQDPPELSTPLDLLGFIIEKAREYDVQVPSDEMEEGSNPSDDRDVSVLESGEDNPAGQELLEALSGLDVDRLAEVRALVSLGNGDWEASEWRQALAQARSEIGPQTVGELIETPLLGDLLEEGLAMLDRSMREYEVGPEGPTEF